ncbi:MAG: hypothetical protein JOZ48_08075 [Acidobacteriaceae bacterium]|nr:hypothetical protein [Acidobacteriaceae bacterium]
MLPLTILATQKLSNLLTFGNALQDKIAAIAASCSANVPLITSGQIVLSSISPKMDDMNVQLGYPRICLYSSAVKNTQIEKFRSLSGAISVVADIWASANLATQTDQWIHFYVEAMTEILRQNIGDWGDGFFFPGSYEVEFQTPASGGFGFTQSAKVTCNLDVSRN